jgi:hypothetical protein
MVFLRVKVFGLILSDFSNRVLCPRNPIFLEKSDFSNPVPKRAQEIRFFWKNRISQTRCPNVPKKSDFFGKIGFLKPGAQGAQEIRFFLEKSEFSNRVPKRAQEIRFFGLDSDFF